MWKLVLALYAGSLGISDATQSGSQAGPLYGVTWPERFDNPEPTDEETYMLVLVNRFRADPLGVARLIADDPARLGRDPYPGVDWEMFLAECGELGPSPPLVHDLRLAKPARSHAVYTLANDHWGHEEREGGHFFTGRGPHERLKAAGIAFRASENAGPGRPGPWSLLAGFVLDDGPGGAGGMQDGRGHRASLHRFNAKVGCAGILSRAHLSPATFYVGYPEGRFLGGVVYCDRNGNGKFDMGEGIDGVRMRAKRKPLGVSWESGGYAIPLSGSTPKSILYELGGIEIKHALPKGADNVWQEVDFRALVENDFEKRVQKVHRSLSADNVPSKVDLLYLLFWADSVPLPEELLDRFEASTQNYADAWNPVRTELNDLAEEGWRNLEAKDINGLIDLARKAERSLPDVPQARRFQDLNNIGRAIRKVSQIRVESKAQEEKSEAKARLFLGTSDARLRQWIRKW